MFDEELVRLIIKRKEDKVKDLQAETTPNQDDIDELNKEINYLKACIIRYKIAKLLKLEKNEDYINNNYLGIENENINEYSLSPEEKVEYNNLISALPPEQLTNYKIRKQISTIIGEEESKEFESNDYIGIESINPKLNKYNLSEQQINEFNQLVEQINNNIEDTTRRVDITKETISMLEEAFNKLNVEDPNEYSRLKTAYMDTLDNILNHIQKESRKKIHAKANNYKYAIDLREKYPELDIILNVKAAQQLLSFIENNTLEEEKYNDYIDYLCNNINKLYEDDNNKEEIENMLNSINKNNYSLRKALKDRLPQINNIKLSIQDEELEKVFKHLDKNYNNLEKKEREIIYSMLIEKINKDINNLNKIDNLNKLFLSITNKNFGERLQNTYSSNEMAKFSHQHFTSHQALVKDKISEIKKLIQKYESKKPKTGALAAFYDAKILDLKKEIKKLESINNHTFNNAMLDILDNQYNNKTDKIIELKKEIKRLEELKSSINSNFHKSIIDKKIKHRKEKIEKLKKSKIKIVGKHKKIMAPRLYVDRKRGLFTRHLESKIETFDNYSKNYKKMANTERKLNGLFSEIKAAFYDFQAGRYKSKAEFNRVICEGLKDGKVKVKGRNKNKMNKNTLNNIRARQTMQSATQTM